MTKNQADSGLPEHVEVLIIGAGISLDAACHLRMNLPDRSFAILEAMDGFGGTWWTHRYPGARSDSDLYTYAFGFRPWQGRSIATAEEIHSYLGDVIKEYDLGSKIHYGHRVQTVSWSSEQKRWTVEVSRKDTGEHFSITTDFLWLGPGTTTIARALRRSGTGSTATRERSCIRSTGRKTSTMPASGWS